VRVLVLVQSCKLLAEAGVGFLVLGGQPNSVRMTRKQEQFVCPHSPSGDGCNGLNMQVTVRCEHGDN